uniref:Uncharacterized protein n=1 Tax=Anguilla anguilla TaxID=7936 RepID=A0A0E9PS87_ANGAN
MGERSFSVENKAVAFTMVKKGTWVIVAGEGKVQMFCRLCKGIHNK